MSTLTRAMTSPSMVESLNKIPFKLLEIKVISAHDLPPVSKCLHTYVMAWATPENKLITPVDHKGNTNPTWNYRMVFGVDEKFLRSESSSIMLEIYNISRLSNKPIGTTCLPVDILLNNPSSTIMKKPLTLQLCRPTGDLKGFLVVSVNLVNTTIRNRNEVDENSPRQFMIRQISQRLSHSESSKRMSLEEDEEDHGALSDPERGSVDLDMTPLPSDVAAAFKNGALYSPNEDHAGPGTSMFDNCPESNADKEEQNVSLSLLQNRDDKVLKKGEEPKMRSRHRRHSDGGLLSCFTTKFEFPFICGSSMNKNMNKKLTKKMSTKKSKGHVMDYPPDQENTQPHDT